MFSALKRWTKMGSDESKLSMPSGVKAMGQALQRKFARGVQYNMKIIIKGDRNTGKTCMFHRLQGKPFNEQYIPTNEIQAGSIHWTYKAADDIVKVDVWDVVDVGKSKKLSDSLKIENTPSMENEAEDSVVADANFLDVYKGTHGVIMVMDITKPWTFQYIRRELPKVPAHIPVLVLGSHRDMEEHRLIDQEEVTNFIQNLERPDRSPPVHYAESSMKNGFGLKYIHTFLNFPFLLLQREALLQQLQVNAMDMESTLEELQIYKQTEAQDYGKYIDYLEEKHLEHERKLKAEAEACAAAENAAQGSNENVSSSSASPPQTNKAASSKDFQPGGLRRWFSSSKPNTPNDEVTPKQQPASNAAMSSSNIEEFKPEDELDAGFLEDDSSAKEKAKVKNQPKKKSVEVEEIENGSSDESESDSGPVNPMVASFTEDISDDETVTNGNVPSEDISTKPDVKPRPAVTDVHITSSEEEEEEEKIEVLKPEVIKPTPVAVPKNKTKESNLKLKVKEDSTSNTSIRRPENKHDNNDIDDWLDSPDLEPKISFGTPKEIEYTVTKVDINNSSQSPPPAPSITMDEWSIFMSEQMKTKEKKSKKPSLDEDEEPANESKHHKKKEHKSGEKSRRNKHKKHKEKDDENERGKEPRRSKHKDTDKEKRKSEDSEKKKKSRPKHSKKRSIDSGSPQGLVTYEEL